MIMLAQAARDPNGASPRCAASGAALTDLHEELLHCVLAALPQTDLMRVRQVSRGLRDAVGRMPASLAVRLRVCLPPADGGDAAPASRCAPRPHRSGLDHSRRRRGCWVAPADVRHMCLSVPALSISRQACLLF